jgi:putative ABC transport system permease protein
MRTSNVLRGAGRTLSRNRVRSFLTTLGIAIGVACVLATVGIGEGARLQTESQLRSLGMNFLIIFPGTTTSSGARTASGTNSRLSEEDVDAIRREVGSVAFVSATTRTVAQVVAGDQNWSTAIVGGQKDWLAIRAWTLRSGRFFGDPEDRSAAKVCVLGTTVVANLFGDEDPVGRTIRVKNLPFVVLGVLSPKGSSLMGQDQDDVVVAPYETVRKKLLGTTAVGGIVASAKSESLVAAAQEEITALLRQRHRIDPAKEADDFLVRSQEELIRQAEDQAKTIGLLLWSVAGVSLLVGGVGIMNIMLVSVTERTREIGLRMAVGARDWDIRGQFLTEAVALSLAGGVLGVALGLGIQWGVARVAHWPVSVRPLALVLGFGFSALVGVAFGFFPALRASRLDPIAAMKYE